MTQQVGVLYDYLPVPPTAQMAPSLPRSFCCLHPLFPPLHSLPNTFWPYAMTATISGLCLCLHPLRYQDFS